MTRKRSAVSGVASSQAIDDLKVIRGIGPLTEKYLRDGGLHTFAQLATQSPEDIAACIPNVSATQVRKQGWILQARKLISKKGKPKPSKKKTTDPTSRQHYENFTLEFLLNEKNKIRRLRIMHVQSGDVNTWASWSPNEISQFLSHHTGAKLIHTAPDLAVATPEPVTQPATQFSKPEPEKVNVPLPAPAVSVVETPTNSLPEKPIPQPVSTKQFETIRLVKWTNFLANSNQPVNSLSHDQNFDVKLTVELTQFPLPDNSQLNVTGILFAKEMGKGTRLVISETQKILPSAPVFNLTIDHATLPQGLYRLDAMIKLNPIGVKFPASIDASFQGGLLQVY